MKQMPAVLEEYGIGLDELLSLGGGASRAAQECTGTKALMLAVLEDAINSYFNGKGRTRAEAEHWITTPRGGARLSRSRSSAKPSDSSRKPSATRCAACARAGYPSPLARRARPHVRRQRLTW